MTGQVSHLFVLKSREVFPLLSIAPPFWLHLHLIDSEDWLLVLQISSCAVRVAVGIRLGLNLCEPHTCQCGAMVDARGLHSFLCMSAPSRTARHHALNNIIYRAFSSVGIPATKEAVGLTPLDGKRPDGLTLVPWCAGKPLTWDVTAVSSLADSYVDSAAREAGAQVE